MITLFYRLDSDSHTAPCDVADSPVVTLAGVAAGYIGAAWGEHTPTDVERFHHCQPDEVDDVLAGWNLKRPVEPSPIGDQG